MPFNEFPFIRYTLFFALGVLIYPYSGFCNGVTWFWLTIMVFATYGIGLMLNLPNGKLLHRYLLPILAYVGLVLAGISFSNLRDARNQATHIIHLSQAEAYIGAILTQDIPKAKTTANRIAIKKVLQDGKWMEASGTVLIYHSGRQHLLPGDVILVNGFPSLISPPDNPYEFDYKQFMERQQVFHSHFFRKEPNIIKVGGGGGVWKPILTLRRKLQEHIQTYIPNHQSQQIAQALLLGQKEDMEISLKEAYSTAGAMHILAVSGLHVGIIYGFFLLFFKPHKLPGYKRVPYLLMVIVVIWFYAILTGMSPSVLRSATMFSFISFAQMRSRSPSIFNPLAISALLLLLYDPFIIYAVGFQLSYAALTGILIFQPFILSLWTPKHRILEYAWQITSVSLAAQLATFPISAYYFHLFPTYFLIANLVAIPGAFVMMSTGLPFLLSILIPSVSTLLGQLFNAVVQAVNSVIFFINELPGARVSHIHLEWPEMMAYWGFLVCLLMAFQNKEVRALKMAFAFLCILVVLQWQLLFSRQFNSTTTVYALREGVAVDYFFRGQLFSYMEGVTEEEYNFKILPNRIRKGRVRQVDMSGVRLRDKTLLILLPSGNSLSLGKGKPTLL